MSRGGVEGLGGGGTLAVVSEERWVVAVRGPEDLRRPDLFPLARLAASAFWAPREWGGRGVGRRVVFGLLALLLVGGEVEVTAVAVNPSAGESRIEQWELNREGVDPSLCVAATPITETVRCLNEVLANGEVEGGLVYVQDYLDREGVGARLVVESPKVLARLQRLSSREKVSVFEEMLVLVKELERGGLREGRVVIRERNGRIVVFYQKEGSVYIREGGGLVVVEPEEVGGLYRAVKAGGESGLGGVRVEEREEGGEVFPFSLVFTEDFTEDERKVLEALAVQSWVEMERVFGDLSFMSEVAPGGLLRFFRWDGWGFTTDEGYYGIGVPYYVGRPPEREVKGKIAHELTHALPFPAWDETVDEGLSVYVETRVVNHCSPGEAIAPSEVIEAALAWEELEERYPGVLAFLLQRSREWQRSAGGEVSFQLVRRWAEEFSPGAGAVLESLFEVDEREGGVRK